jgi:hypothetical protein
MNRASKILLVENDASWSANFTKTIKKCGETRECIVLRNADEFLEKFEKGSEFQDIWLCILDLELGAHLGGIANDLDGLEVVLPAIKEKAPWIPVCCMSSYLDDHEILARLSTSDFDGLFSKPGMYSKGKTAASFNSDAWEKLIQGLHIKRAAGMSSLTVTEVSRIVYQEELSKIVADKPSERIINEIGAVDFKIGLGLLGIVGKEIVVSEIGGGFSGLYTLRVEVTETGGSPFRSTWVIKFGFDIEKLMIESRRHNEIFVRGFSRKFHVPQIHRQVATWNGCGFIGYCFEEGADTALSSLKARGAENLMKLTAKICEKFYVAPTAGSVRFRDVLIEWFGYDKSEATILEDERTQGRNLKVTKAFLHGDLHLSNIMINGDSPILIDFAQANSGPMAIDAAKFIADMAVFFYTPLLLGAPPNIADISKSNLGSFYNIFKKYLSAKDDDLLFCLLIEEYLKQYETFSDVSPKAKVDIEKVLRKSQQS